MSRQHHLVYQRSLTVVYVGNDGNVSNVLHTIPIYLGYKVTTFNSISFGRYPLFSCFFENYWA
ncbi:hypothetical protein EVA_17932 [gut metagenome]|uniref:Uncharacterized protein n=1 Tax=gut metagenome TaxID=749906 RepID=J9G324_9ZZZZ